MLSLRIDKVRNDGIKVMMDVSVLDGADVVATDMVIVPDGVTTLAALKPYGKAVIDRYKARVAVASYLATLEGSAYTEAQLT